MATAFDSSPGARIRAVRDTVWVAAVVVLGVALSLAAHQRLRQADDERARFHLSFQAQASASALHAAAELRNELLHNLSELMGRRGELSRADFSEVVRPLLRRHQGLRALEWVPVVLSADRGKVEAKAGSELGRPFEFTQINSVGAMVRAADSSANWPVLYAEPLAGNEAVMGYDLMVGPTGAALEQARDKGDLVLSWPTRLMEEQGKQLGYERSCRCIAAGRSLGQWGHVGQGWSVSCRQ